QTIGSAGESVAGGVVFTIPALIFLTPYGPQYFSYYQITMLAFAGGILGVLMMVPLRRALIVKEHGVLPYPEGAACADVLIAGERGGALAATVFKGLAVGAIWKALSWIVQLFRTVVGYSMSRASFFPNATLNSSFRESMKTFGAGQRGVESIRTERDLPIAIVIGGSLLLGIFMIVMPGMPTQGNILAAVLLLVFGFFFVTVSSRITGLIG